jgi:hypothetical protein
MKFFYQAELFFILFISSLACGQEPARTTSQAGPPPLELKLTKGPMWKGTCLELSIQLTNVSKSSIFLDAMYQGTKVYSSVSDPTNTLGQGAGEAWMLLYGWTDVVSEPIELAPRTRRRNTLCVAETFPVKEAGKETLRQVRVQGRLRIVAGYEIPTWKIVDQSQGNGRRAYVRVVDKSSRWKFGEALLEVPIPCPKGIGTSECLSSPEIFPGEHDIHKIGLEPPPAIEIQPPPPPIFPIGHPLAPKPSSQLLVNAESAAMGRVLGGLPR